MEELIELLKTVQNGDSTVDLSNNAIVLDALRKAMAKGGQTEKDKAYSEIATLKAQLANSAQSAKPQGGQTTPEPTTLEQLMAILGKQGQTSQPIPSATTTPQPNGAGLTKEDVAQLMAEMFNARVPEILKKQLEPFTAQLTAIQSESLEQYRVRKIAELGNSVVPELVRGSSKEDIDASIELAKTIAARYGTQSQQTQPQPQGQAAQGQQPVGQQQPQRQPPPIVQPSAGAVQPTDVSKLSDAEFVNQRDAILRSLQSMV
jgi:hypothetical protein